MSDPNFCILYVENPTRSAHFYTDVLGKEPVEASDNFAMFALASGTMLGLWARHDVQPETASQPGCVELGLTEQDSAAVDARHSDWKARGIAIVQAPVRMDFGYTFTAEDPDGHRLRVFAPN